MDSQGPTAAVRAGAPTDVGTSRLAQMQMRFQQRQQQERDQRKIEQIATRTTTTTTMAGAVVTSSNGRTATSSAASATVELSERLNATTLSSSLGAGKVRQMFDERRHRVAGIDKSYPLQPIQTKTTAAGVATTTTSTTTTTTSATNGNYSVNGNNSSNGGLPDGSLSRGTAKAGLNNKTRVPPISANSRPRLMQQQQQGQRGQNLRQDSNAGMQATRSSNAGETLLAEANAAGFDDNDNFLELEKFPDTMSLEGDLLDSTNHIHSPNGNYVPVKTARSNGTTRTLPNSTVQKATKKPSVTTTTPSSASSTPRSTNGSAKSGPVPSRFVGSSSKSNGPSRAVTQPSPVSSAGSVRKASSSGGSMLAASSLANEPVPDGLERCDICSRNFAEDRIEKHRTICQKTKAKKRKVFDVTKHRVQGTDAEKYVLRAKKSNATGGATHARKPSSQMSSLATPAGQAAAGGAGKPSNWRKKHEEFIATIRAAKELKAHLAKGGKLSDLPPPPPAENPDYVQCPHCSRRFNQGAAERHIPKCATMLHNKPKAKPKAVSTVRRY